MNMRIEEGGGEDIFSWRVSFRGMMKGDSVYLFLGTSRLGNRSEMRPRKTGVSSATIFGVLKSL